MVGFMYFLAAFSLLAIALWSLEKAIRRARTRACPYCTTRVAKTASVCPACRSRLPVRL